MTEQEKERRERQRKASLAANERNGGSMTVDEWCKHRRVSRSMAYKLWLLGKGPATYYVGKKRMISSEADAAWVRAREAETATAEAA